jgi:chemotaxis protein MotB
MAKHNSNNTIIVKKVRRANHETHHGGAWKVAYADFVTAMMAFFLLLWLLNVTTDVQKRGIADYFQPSIASSSKSGAGGVLGGRTIGLPGAAVAALSQPSLVLDRPALRQPNDGEEGDENGATGQDPKQQDADGADDAANDNPAAADAKPVDDAALAKELAQREEQRFKAAEAVLRQAVEQVPELRQFADNLVVDDTPQGLRIQIVDQAKSPMFPLGSAEMLEPARKLMALVTQVIMRLPNKITITGHTDSTQYTGNGQYTNWELSADRANASRREFIADGLPPDRIEQVVGMADREPLVAGDPSSPRNRRISIVLLRATKPPAPTHLTQNGAGPAPPASPSTSPTAHPASSGGAAKMPPLPDGTAAPSSVTAGAKREAVAPLPDL